MKIRDHSFRNFSSRPLSVSRKPSFRIGRCAFGLCCALTATALLGWGPHPDITANAIKALGPEAPLASVLGPEFDRLRTHCWIPDVWMQLSSEYYFDDYLFTPQRPTHIGTSHAFTGPDGKYGQHNQVMFDIYFRRALQALRTESPANAARWVGALLHFTEDTGAPPHAINESGALHGPMENWVDGKKISIAGYTPKVLGSDDTQAFAGYWQNQEKLHAFTAGQAHRIKALVAAGNRTEAEPLIRACADESARKAADLCATLGALAGAGPKGCGVRGRISGATDDDCALAKIAAKIMLEGTGYSTLAAPDGTYEFRNLPAGAYRLFVAHPGNEVYSGEVTLSAAAQTFDITLAPARVKGNLFRNPALTLRWASKDHIDMWYKAGKGGWRTEAVPVVAGATYALEAQWKNTRGKMTVCWSTHEREGKQTAGPSLIPPDTKRSVTAPDGVKFAFVTVEGPDLPDTTVSYVALTPHAE